MSTATYASTDSYGPVLVSEVPPSAVTTTGNRFQARFLDMLQARRDARTFDRAVRNAGHNEAHDLLAAGRRS